MGKYDPLREHLTVSGQPRITMTFDQMARLVGELKSSAWDHRAWWGNDRTHVHAVAWLDAGYRVDSVDQSRGVVTFSQIRGKCWGPHK